MQLICPSCGKAIPAQDINIELAIAKCGACHEVFNFAEDVGGFRRNRPKVGPPKRFTVESLGPELVITRRWFNHSVWFLLLFCFVWDGFLVFWYSMVFAMWNGNAGPIVLLPLLFPILHVTMGIGLTYTVLCTFVNRTTISVSYGELSVRHGPLFWPGNARHMATDIKQLYCTDTWSRGKYGGNYTYNVMAVKSDDVRVKLISGLEELDDALFIEQEIEQHLKIRDERVPGELQC